MFERQERITSSTVVNFMSEGDVVQGAVARLQEAGLTILQISPLTINIAGTPAAFGLSNVRPMAIYSYLYPFAPESLRRIAYYFDFDYAADADPTGYAADVIAYAASWQRDTNRGTLTYVTAPDGRLSLLDTRPERTIAQLTLCGLERAAYEYCDELHAVAGVTRHLHDRFPDVDFTEAQVREFLDSLVANRLMVTDGANYLSLAICADLNDAPAADGLSSNDRAIETQGLDPWRVIQRA
jgi:hypothetical protein